MGANSNLYLSSLMGGGIAGLVVDTALFPLDTVKTRLQAPQGFINAGGFRGVYRGIGPQVIGSVPQAALFFCTYEWFKHVMLPIVPNHAHPFVYMAGASISEVVACLVRVPMEVIKQRRQTDSQPKGMSSFRIAQQAFYTEGIFKGLYRGFGSTILREIPFSFIQFPILEHLKIVYKDRLKKKNLTPLDVANCGAVAGGVAAAITTPLDVVKTRIMLAGSNKTIPYWNVWRLLYLEKGMQGLFAGFVPRVLWITLGGYIFFGMYDFSKSFVSEHLLDGYNLEN